MLQEIASIAVVKSCSVWNIGAGSCECIVIGIVEYLSSRAKSTEHIELLRAEVFKSYRDFSMANEDSYGFQNISANDWFFMSLTEKTKYRREMLYYFWMANQEM